MAIFTVPSALSKWKPSADRRLSYSADFHGETSGLRTTSATGTSSSGAPGACDPGSLAFACRTANDSSSCACDLPCLHQVSEEDVGEAAVVEDVPDPAAPEQTSSHTNLGPDAVNSTLYSLSTRRRRVHDSGPTHPISSADRAR